MQVSLLLIIQDQSFGVRQFGDFDFIGWVHSRTEKHFETLVISLICDYFHLLIDLIIDLSHSLIEAYDVLLKFHFFLFFLYFSF